MDIPPCPAPRHSDSSPIVLSAEFYKLDMQTTDNGFTVIDIEIANEIQDSQLTGIAAKIIENGELIAFVPLAVKSTGGKFATGFLELSPTPERHLEFLVIYETNVVVGDSKCTDEIKKYSILP
jgi:predicted aspartyl protease